MLPVLAAALPLTTSGRVAGTFYEDLAKAEIDTALAKREGRADIQSSNCFPERLGWWRISLKAFTYL